MKKLLEEFIKYVQEGEDIELYNEAGLQHELALFLRRAIGKDYCIRLEYPTNKAGVSNKLVKKEMDVYLIHKNDNKKYCIELKTPVNLQVPKIMYDAIKDIMFLSQLVNNEGFAGGYLLFVSHNDDFWKTKKELLKIYKMFRGKVDIQTLDSYHLPAFIQEDYAKETPFVFTKNYGAEWLDLKKQGTDNWRYFLIEV